MNGVEKQIPQLLFFTCLILPNVHDFRLSLRLFCDTLFLPFIIIHVPNSVDGLCLFRRNRGSSIILVGAHEDAEVLFTPYDAGNNVDD